MGKTEEKGLKSLEASHRRVTIQDIAEKAGVGKVTVSYVLNGRADQARISQSTKERILAVASELHYRPNAIGRMLSRKQADAIAIVFQYGGFFSSNSNFTMEVMRSVCAACVEAGVDVMLHTKPTGDPCEEANNLSDGRVDAVIMIRDEGDATHEALIERDFPAVLFFCRSVVNRASYVVCDNFAGGKMAIQHLVGLGHKRIGMLKGAPKSVDSNDRFWGYRSGLVEANLTYDPTFVMPFVGDEEDREAVRRLMLREDRPTALFVWSDDVVPQLLQIVNQLGLRVPEDLSIVGFDGTEASSQIVPPLTTIRQPIREIASLAVRVALGLARGTETTSQIVLPPSLIIRGSTAAPK
ncbi:MAG: LacI family transcriptional regulator [Fimbriimonadaceae bacterium]|jgi:LacI family transcriptional regulator|nr:LacI family transcriptional regulator [Fimbriimonadaceae bacterium]